MIQNIGNGRGSGEQAKKVKGIKKHKLPAMKCHEDVKYSIGNAVNTL